MTLAPGDPFPDLELPDHAGNPRRLSDLVAGDPTVPYVPRVYMLSPGDLRIHAVYDGYWYSGRATLEELRQDLRAIQRVVRADFDAPAA